MPNILMKSRTPYPRDDALPNTIITITIKKLALPRLQCSSSMNVETLVSINETALVSAASNTSTKNSIPAPVPMPMLAKTFGNVINIREGPACSVSGLPPEKAKTAGMIIKPANTAIPVSKISICVVVCSRSISLLI